MNREIKFRLWDKSKNEWFVPIYQASEGKLKDASITLSGQVILRSLDSCATLDENFIISQFTGLLDKHGKEIFENDLIRVCDNKNGNFKVEFINAYVVGWILTSQQSENYISLGGRKQSEIEIIGNVFDNPELLK